MKNSSCFFANKECKYYPCHKEIESINCMFCYCPLYGKEKCPGTPVYIEADGKKIKDCSNCVFPHEPQNYEIIVNMI